MSVDQKSEAKKKKLEKLKFNFSFKRKEKKSEIYKILKSLVLRIKNNFC